MRFVLEVMDWQSLCNGSMGLHRKQLIVLTISKSQVQTSDKAEGACSEASSPGANVPKMSFV